MKCAIWLAGAALSVAAPAAVIDQQAELKRFDAALTARDVEQAARIADSLMEARRPADNVLRTDPVLNSVYGRLALARDAYSARAFLERADLADLPAEMRTRTLSALATAQELTGDDAAAEATLAKLALAPLDAVQRRRVTVTRARLALMSDAARARTLASPLIASASTPAERWEPELIEAAALSLAGQGDAARAASLRAWTDAADAPAAENAPVRVSLVRAAIVDGADERVAMLEVAKVADNPIDAALADRLPQCGGVLSPSDYATFAASLDTSGSATLIPVRASRPAAILPLARAVKAKELFASQSDSAGGGLFTIRCRTMISPRYEPSSWRANPMLDWTIAHGIYSTASDESQPDAPVLERKLAELSARYGADSPRLIPSIDALGRQLMADGEDAAGPKVRALQSRLHAVVRRAAGLGALLPTEQEIEVLQAAATGEPTEDAKARMLSTVAAIIERFPRDEAYEAAMGLFATPHGGLIDAKGKRTLAETLLKRFPASEGGPRRRALLVRLADSDRTDQRVEAAQASLRAASAPVGLCALMDETPLLTDMNITADDYPPLLAEHQIEGTSTVEYDVGIDGRVAASRVILSSPANLFDDTVTREFGDFRITPASVGNKPVACQGVVQTVKWRLPSDAGADEDTSVSDLKGLIKELQPAEGGK